MKKLKSGKRLLFVALLALSIGLFGCSGNDGATGATGATGPAGPAGPVTTTGEACAVCHGSGKIADVAGSMGPNVAAGNQFGVDPTVSLPQLSVSNVATTATVDTASTPNTVTLTTTFTVAGNSAYDAFAAAATSDTAATGLASTALNSRSGLEGLAYVSVAYAQLQDQSTATPGLTPQWVNLTHGDSTPADFTVTPNGSNYDCTMTTVFTQNDATTGPAFADYLNTTRTRTLIILKGTSATNPNDVIYDFMPNGAATLSPSRDVVTEAACNSCHANLGGNGIQVSENLSNALGLDFPKQHEGNYYKIEACVVCHTDANYAPGNNGVHPARVIQTLIHQIHQEIDQTKLTDASGNPLYTRADDWSKVTYPDMLPTGSIDCTMCHKATTDAAFDAKYPYGNGADAANFENNPTKEGCTSCHTNVVFDGSTTFTSLDGTTGLTHPVETDANCTVCHFPTGTFGNSYNTGIVTAHITPQVVGTPEYTSWKLAQAEFVPVITMTPPADSSNSYYVQGSDAPVVTVQLKYASGPNAGQLVPGSVYTTLSTDATSKAGVSGGGLSAAVLMVYGPRADAVPVLTTDSTTDPNLAAGAAPEQEHSLLLPSTDPLVSADANGFHYQLEKIPATLANGTYVVQFQGNDYGYVSSSDYTPFSSAAITFQIGQTNVEPKVDGDGCISCHDTTHMHISGKYAHNVPFDTDYCQACHDQSGNHGDPIANRVHAVHDANSQGDLSSYTNGVYAANSGHDWSGDLTGDTAITFPQNDQSCVMCHTATTQNTDGSALATPVDNAGTYLTKPYEMPCFGCHADGTGVIDHMQQNGGKLP